jgi:hypothetical protein
MNSYQPPDPSPEGKARYEKDQAATDEIMDRIEQAKANWFKGWMVRLVPAELYEFAYSKRPRERMKVVRFLQDAQIVRNELADGRTQIAQAGRILGEFRARWNGTQLNLEAKDLTGPPAP